MVKCRMISLYNERLRMSVLTTSIQHYLEGFIQCHRQEKEIKCIKIEKNKVGLSLFKYNLIVDT